MTDERSELADIQRIMAIVDPPGGGCTRQDDERQPNLWLDDLRPPPDDTWLWTKHCEVAAVLLRVKQYRTLSLDHDLGGDVTSRALLLWLTQPENGAYWPDEVRVHSQNPVGRQWLEGMIERYKP